MNDRIDPLTPSSSAVLQSHVDPTSARFEANMRFLADLGFSGAQRGRKDSRGRRNESYESQHNKGR